MNTKKTVLQRCEKHLAAPCTFAFRVCKVLKSGEFDSVLSSEDLTALLNEGPGKHVRSNSLTALMQPLLREDIVKAKVTGKAPHRRKYWFPGWISKDDAGSQISGSAVSPATLFSQRLTKAFGKEFKTELHDLVLNFGKSGTCTAFLLRKILEKLIFLKFARNNQSAALRDANGYFVGLKTMLDLSTQTLVHGKPFLMPRTKQEIEGIKFLGDASAHDFLTNVEMKTIIPQLPFIITAYEELAT